MNFFLSRTPVYADEDDNGMQDNPMYVSAGPRNQKQTAGESGVGDGAVYSTVDKNRIVVDSSKNDVYAEVDKTNKAKANKGKQKKEKSKQGFMKDKKGKKLMQDGKYNVLCYIT
ncbi:uncharacterized protein LOC128554189 [Mercenaria mercenaria]|uniref:uncharacterized protein LOC128554189 n=1 Tax=Mercenaria mercenaria TaxID=6596 RepID=UPI00234E667D|nr:uncharacterized protein LOC128554189 [Mercenaria mercenaria]